MYGEFLRANRCDSGAQFSDFGRPAELWRGPAFSGRVLSGPMSRRLLLSIIIAVAALGAGVHAAQALATAPGIGVAAHGSDAPPCDGCETLPSDGCGGTDGNLAVCAAVCAAVTALPPSFSLQFLALVEARPILEIPWGESAIDPPDPLPPRFLFV